tara:strand:- start:94 stop:759 length:666 start_codon:yes stop_codon:yes gene_type:complete
MATLWDRQKLWNVPEHFQADILIYLGHVLHNYKDENKEPPDYLETKQMLEQMGYNKELIAEQKGQIRSMLWKSHTLYEKGYDKGALNIPGVARGGKTKTRRSKKGGDDDDEKKTKKNKDELIKRGKINFQESEYYKNMKNEKNAHTDESLDVMKEYLKLEGLTESQAEKEVSSLPRSFQAAEVHEEALSGGKRKRRKTHKKRNRKTLKKRNRRKRKTRRRY